MNRMREAIHEFLDAEIRNEQHGGARPTTLLSAADSLSQAPAGVIQQWFGFGDSPEETAELIEALAFFALLAASQPNKDAWDLLKEWEQNDGSQTQVV